MRIVSPRSTDTVPATPKSGKAPASSRRSRLNKAGNAQREQNKQVAPRKSDDKLKKIGQSMGSQGSRSMLDLPSTNPSTPTQESAGSMGKGKGKEVVRESKMEAIVEGQTESLPASPSKDAALHSHPVAGQEGSGGLEDKFETPAEERKDGKKGVLDGK